MNATPPRRTEIDDLPRAPRSAPARASLTCAVLLLAWCGALAAAPQKKAKSDAAVKDEIDFARGLASEWGFIDMAQQVVANTEAAGVSERMAQELALLKCELYSVAASINRERRDELLEQSVNAYDEFLQRYAYSDLKDRAEAQAVNASGLFARSLSMRLEDATGEEATKVKDKLQGVLDKAIAQAGGLVSGLIAKAPEERTEAENQRLYELLLTQGDLFLELASTQDEPVASYLNSYRAYERLVDEAGDSSPAGLRAMVGLGDNQVAQGKYADASAYYEFVVNLAIPRDQQAWADAKKEMTTEEVEKRFLFVQLATSGLVKSLAKAGQFADACGWGLHFYNTFKREGLNLQSPLGYLAMLDVASTLVEAGGFVGGDLNAGEGRWFPTQEEMAAKFPARREQRSALDLALSMAQTVNDENRGNTLQIRAQKVIGEIISRPGVEVDPEVLFEAAKGSYNAREYDDALESFKGVLAALEHADAAKRTEIGPKVLWHMGRSYQQLGRLPEAAVTFQNALERFSGDPDFDVRNANGFFDTMKVLNRQLKSDAVVNALYAKSEAMVAQYNSGAKSAIEFKKAEDAFAAKNWSDAKALYAAIPVDSPDYEKARVYTGVCEYQLENHEAAQAIFDEYLHKYLEDPKNLNVSGVVAAKRLEAKASATFYWGLSAVAQAEAGKQPWTRVVELLKDFEETFPQQDRLAPAAMYRVLLAHDHLGQRPDVRRVYEKMLAKFPDSQWTGRAATTSYSSLRTAWEKETDADKKSALLREMAENLQVLNRTAPTPSYKNMSAEASHWMDLHEYATAEELLQRIATKFETENADDIRRSILPILGEAQLRQGKSAEAATTLKELVDSKKAARPTAQTYARAEAGWLDASAGADGKVTIKVMPGVADEAALNAATEVFKQLDNVAEKWTTDWFEYKADMLYAYYVWGLKDSKKLETVKNQLDFVGSPGNLGPTYKHDLMPEGVRQKFLWLREKVK